MTDRPAGAAPDESSPPNRAAAPGSAASRSGKTGSRDLPPLDAGAKSPDDLWDDYFAKRRPAAATVRDLVSSLHEAGKHDHVAAVIRAALRHGQGQPWMYEVLALTLRIQGAPKSEIERALLSPVDFAATDAPGLMLSAAYLTRFDADRPALRLYRQASELAPERPEPYLLGLKLAKKLADDDALAWAARGVLTSAWGEGHERQHREAEDAVADRAKQLRQDGKASEADALAAAVAAAKAVDLAVRLDWAGTGAVDLTVREPSGTACSFENPRTQGGGVLTHDGHGPRPENCFDEYVCAAGFPGVYRIEVRHGWGDIAGKRAKLTITRHRGTPHESVREVSVPVTADGTTVRVTLTDGRREALLRVPDEKPQAATPRPARRLVAAADGDAEAAARQFRDTLFRQVGAGGIAAGGGTPFAVGATPTVGAGAVGYQPTIAILNEGVNLTTQAVVSGDRRYVRLTLSPNFTAITNVATFTFAR